MTSILVTGGAGFMGSAFMRRAYGEVVALDALTYAGRRDNLEPHHAFVHGDIRDAALVSRVIDEHAIDTIVHFAAETHVDRSIASPDAFIDTNIVGTMRLLECVRARPHVRFHHVSTDEVYGPLELDDPPVDETAPYRPSSPYAASKAASDHLVLAWARTFGLRVTISHASNGYGPRQYPEKLIPATMARIRCGERVRIYGDGLHVRDWLHVDDHADAITAILERGTPGEIYDIPGGNPRSNLEVARAILDGFRAPHGMIQHVDDRPGHDRRYAMVGEKIRALGWQPRVSFDRGLKDLIRAGD